MNDIEAARRELRPGERLEWCARPMRWALARSQLRRSLYGLPVLVVSISWIVGVRHTTELTGAFDPLFWLIGVPIALIGCALLFSAPRAFLQASSVVYAVTDQRVFIRWGRKAQSWGPRDLNVLERRDRADGSGDLIFRTDVRESAEGAPTATHHGFYGIRQARDVEAKIAKLRERVSI